MKKIFSILALSLICSLAKGEEAADVTAVCDAASVVRYTPEDQNPFYGYIQYYISALSDKSLEIRYSIVERPTGLVPKLQYITGHTEGWLNEATEESGDYCFTLDGPFTEGQEIRLNLFLAYAGGQSEISADYIYGSDEDMIEPLTMEAAIIDITSTTAALSWDAYIGSLKVPAKIHYSFDNATLATSDDPEVTFTDLAADTEYDITCYAEIELSGEILYSGEITLDFTTLEEPEDGIELIEAGDDYPTEYYNLQGIRINYPRRGAMVICKRGNTITKFVYK